MMRTIIKQVSRALYRQHGVAGSPGSSPAHRTSGIMKREARHAIYSFPLPPLQHVQAACLFSAANTSMHCASMYIYKFPKAVWHVCTLDSGWKLEEKICFICVCVWGGGGGGGEQASTMKEHKASNYISQGIVSHRISSANPLRV